METALNNTCHNILIANRKGTISISPDGNKTWLVQSGKNSDSKFNLTYTTNVQDNRKGIIAHTDVFFCVNIRLSLDKVDKQIIISKKNNSLT